MWKINRQNLWWSLRLLEFQKMRQLDPQSYKVTFFEFRKQGLKTIFVTRAKVIKYFVFTIFRLKTIHDYKMSMLGLIDNFYLQWKQWTVIEVSTIKSCIP